MILIDTILNYTLVFLVGMTAGVGVAWWKAKKVFKKVFDK
jgi:hypothetical protein